MVSAFESMWFSSCYLVTTVAELTSSLMLLYIMWHMRQRSFNILVTVLNSYRQRCPFTLIYPLLDEIPWLWKWIMEWSTVTWILHLSTRWKWMVSFIHWPLYPWEKTPHYPSDERLGAILSHSGQSDEQKKILVPARNWALVIHPIAWLLYWATTALHKFSLFVK